MRVLTIFLIFFNFLVCSCRKTELKRINKTGLYSINKKAKRKVIVKYKIIDLADDEVQDFGICWSNEKMPEITNQNIGHGANIEKKEYCDTIIDLIPDCQYYVRSYIKTLDNIFYSPQDSILDGGKE